MIKSLVVLAALTALLLAPNADAASANVLVIEPDTGEWLSGGVAKTFSGDSSTFSANYDEVSVHIGVDYISPEGAYEGWTMQFAAPPGQPLEVGTYTDIARAPFRAWGQAGWDATHTATTAGGACNTISGSFTVNAFAWGSFKSNGYRRVLIFDADWEIRCSERPETLRGHVHYEDPPDTTPPTFVGTGDQTVEAQNANGGVAFYGVWGYDDYSNQYLPATCTPESGASFPIGANTVTCTATDPAGNTGSATFTINVLPPFDWAVVLTSASVSPKGGDITITGRVNCNRVAGVEVRLAASQQVTKRAAVTASAYLWVNCTAPTTQFTTQLASENGLFLSGKVSVTTSANAYTGMGYYFANPTVTTLVVKAR